MCNQSLTVGEGQVTHVPSMIKVLMIDQVANAYMINVWTKYGDPILYGNGQTDIIMKPYFK
jgi:hypothetical protein